MIIEKQYRAIWSTGKAFRPDCGQTSFAFSFFKFCSLVQELVQVLIGANTFLAQPTHNPALRHRTSLLKQE
jgi:hypothetical protein